MDIPKLGLGTYGRWGSDGLEALLAGLELGYRHLDTAQSYDTEENVGRAIRQSGIPRDEVFVTTKIADTNLAKDRLLPSLEESLRTLGVGHVDLTLIHWPSHRDAVPLAEYMGELARVKALGMTRLIGVSNFTIRHLDESIALLGEGEIATNQVELHPYLQNRKLRDYCVAHGMSFTAYMPLAKGRVANDPVLREIGERHGVTASAVALAWLLQQGAIVIPASGKRENLEANLRAASITLSPEEMAAIATLDRGDRMINPAKAPVWD